MSRDGEEDDDVGDDMGNLSKEHRADALQADAWLRDSETLATTRAVPSRAPAPAAPKEEVRACLCVCVGTRLKMNQSKQVTARDLSRFLWWVVTGGVTDTRGAFVCVCVCVMHLCLVTIHSPRPWLCLSPSGAREFARVEEKGVRSAAARRDRAAGSPEAGQNDQARSRCSGKRH